MKKLLLLLCVVGGLVFEVRAKDLEEDDRTEVAHVVAAHLLAITTRRMAENNRSWLDNRTVIVGAAGTALLVENHPDQTILVSPFPQALNQSRLLVSERLPVGSNLFDQFTVYTGGSSEPRTENQHN